MHRLSIKDSDTGNMFEWSGSLTVNVYSSMGLNLDVFCLAWKPEGNTFAEFAEAVERYAAGE